jgi:oligoendopeptidase F
MLWMEIPHLFEQPLYMISYPVSNDLALQLYAMEREEKGSGAARYLQMLERYDPGSGETLTGIAELIERYGLESPFAEGHAKKTAALLSEAFDLAARG